ncbi:MAG: hypothetical protein WAW80_01675, partial [Candidatus Saccharimonadales bacterium]
VPYSGGVGSKAINRSTYASVEHGFADWGKRNGCDGTIHIVRQPSDSNDGKTVDKLSYPKCQKQTVLYRVNNGEHEWPGGKPASNLLERSEPTKVINVSQIIVNFFGLDG